MPDRTSMFISHIPNQTTHLLIHTINAAWIFGTAKRHYATDLQG